MSTTAEQFVAFAEQETVLRFGEFTLKSGRVSPYFFNAGLFFEGNALHALANFYAKTIIDNHLEFDVLFGPAYKGIPLAAITAMALSQLGKNIPYSFNRKEAKDHGEKGVIVGAPIEGKRVLMIDDVMTAGTAYRESKRLIQAEKGELSGIIIALDRQEVGLDNQSAIAEIQKTDGISVTSIASLGDIIDYLKAKGETQQLNAILSYQTKYGAKSASK